MIQVLTIEYLDRCNLNCAHCAVNASPYGEKKMRVDDAIKCISAASDFGAQYISIAGGEPFLVFDELCSLARFCKGRGLRFNTFSNAFWAVNIPEARRFLAPLRESGLSSLHLSLDCFHIKEGVSEQNLVNIASVSKDLGVEVVINVLQAEGGRVNDSHIKRLFKNYNVKFEHEFVMPMGRAAHIPGAIMGEKENPDILRRGCRSYSSPVISPEGNVFACDGAYLLAQPGNPLFLGNIHKEPIIGIFKKFCESKVLKYISTFGPQGVGDFVNSDGAFIVSNGSAVCKFCCNILNSKDGADLAAEKLNYPTEDVKLKLQLAAICEGDALSLTTKELPFRLKLDRFCRTQFPVLLGIFRELRFRISSYFCKKRKHG